MTREIKFTRKKTAYRGIVKINKYLYVYIPAHKNAILGGRYVALHRLISECRVRRKLEKNEAVNHIDGNTFNNHPDNLEILSLSEHNKLSAKSKIRNKYGKFTKTN